MKKMIKLVFVSLGIIGIIGIIVFLGARSNQMEGMNHEGMVPSSMKDAANPKFPVGSNVILLGDHMEGMKGANAQVVGAFDTTMYEVSYEPKLGDQWLTIIGG